MEYTSNLVYEGKLIHETSYPQYFSKYTEVELDGIKIDHYEPKQIVIHEIKKSNKKLDAQTWQVKYYIYVLQQNGIEGVTDILEYPKLRKTEKIILGKSDKSEIETMNLTVSSFSKAGIRNGLKKKWLDMKKMTSISSSDADLNI